MVLNIVHIAYHRKKRVIEVGVGVLVQRKFARGVKFNSPLTVPARGATLFSLMGDNLTNRSRSDAARLHGIVSGERSNPVIEK